MARSAAHQVSHQEQLKSILVIDFVTQQQKKNNSQATQNSVGSQFLQVKLPQLYNPSAFQWAGHCNLPEAHCQHNSGNHLECGSGLKNARYGSSVLPKGWP